MPKQSAASRGFSLIELLISMVVTTLIVGSIYGLLAGGQNAFRREPELTDRQQNIRVAMDLIMRDVASAGVGMLPFMQTFSTAIDATDPDLEPGADQLEIMSNSGAFENQLACGYPGGSATVLRLQSGTTIIPPTGMTVMVFFADGTWTLRNVTGQANNPPPTAQGNCNQGTPHVQLEFNPGAGDPTGLNQAGGLCVPNTWGTVTGGGPCQVESVGLGEVVRYRVRRPGGPAAQAQLERVSNGDVANPRIVALGVHDLQVRYWRAGNAAGPGPFDGQQNGQAPAVGQACPTVPCNNQAALDSLITRVEVTLSAETATTVFQSNQRFRGRMVQTGAARAAMWVASQAATPAVSRWQ